MAKELQQAEYNLLKAKLDTATVSSDLLDIAAEHGFGLTAKELERAKNYARDEVKTEVNRRVGNEEQAALARELRDIQNNGIRISSKFISVILYQFSIYAVIVLFIGEVLRLTPAIAGMLDTTWLLAVIPTAMLLIGYYVTAVIGKAERKAYTNIIVNRRMKDLADKYLNAEELTPDEERLAKQAAETLQRKKAAGRGYGIVEWIVFVGLHALTAYHTIELHHMDAELPFLLVGSVGFIFLLLVVSKMLVGHIYLTSRKPIETGVQGYDEDAEYEVAYGSAVYRAILHKASAKVADTQDTPPVSSNGHHNAHDADFLETAPTQYRVGGSD